MPGFSFGLNFRCLDGAWRAVLHTSISHLEINLFVGSFSADLLNTSYLSSSLLGTGTSAQTVQHMLILIKFTSSWGRKTINVLCGKVLQKRTKRGRGLESGGGGGELQRRLIT